MRTVWDALGVALRVLVWFVRLTVGTVLVLAEPMVRVVLVPLAFIGFAMAVVFGFLMHAPHFPAWGMLAMSIGFLWAYLLYAVLTAWILGGRRAEH